MANLVLLNNFLHDFSAAGWIFCTFLLWRMMQEGGTHNGALSTLLRTIRQLMLYSAAGIVLFGIIRALAYRTYEWNEAAGRAQITLLIVKHIILAGVFAWGVYYYRRAGRFLQEHAAE